jgi:hypothetical protein
MQIAKSNYMWFRGSISLIINPFLRVFSISGFLKVIHTPKTPQKRCESGTSKTNFLYSVFKIVVSKYAKRVPTDGVCCPNFQ